MTNKEIIEAALGRYTEDFNETEVQKELDEMTYTVEIREGHHIVDMAPVEPVETILEVLKFMTGYKVVEVFAEALNDYKEDN